MQLSLFQDGDLQKAGDAGGGLQRSRPKEYSEKTRQISCRKVYSRPNFPQARPLTSLTLVDIVDFTSLAPLPSPEVTLRYGRKWHQDYISKSISMAGKYHEFGMDMKKPLTPLPHPTHMLFLLMPQGLLTCIALLSSGKTHLHRPFPQCIPCVPLCATLCPRRK